MNGSPLLLWAHVLLIWAVSNYVSRDPLSDENDVMDIGARFGSIRGWRAWVVARALTAGAAVAFLAWPNVPLIVLMLIGSITLPFVRATIPASRCAEVEIGANAVFAVISFGIIRSGQLQLGQHLLTLPASDERIVTACIVVALTFFTVHGGTYIVRGVLKKSGAIPTIAATGPGERTLDVKEFNRGRLIGALERILLLAVIIAGSFEALGFIVAAKGLIRSREFESSRDMTEYFLIGSLSSVLVALAAGSVSRYLIRASW